MKEEIEKQFKKVVLLLRNAQDYSEHDEEIVSLISKFTELELPTPENYPEGKELFTPPEITLTRPDKSLRE